MATRNAKASSPFEPMDKLPSNTLKRHPKMDLNKNDLLRLLSYLEGELQARDISIAALKAEKAKQLLYQAKYGRFGLGDPFHALQRDAEGHKDNSFDEAAIKAMYDNQLTQLENLIATQRKAQHRMREQLAAVEKRYHKLCAELEDEKRKHAQDTAQGDDVTYMLEKERERLKSEVEFEKSQNKKLEKELKKVTSALEEERSNSNKHKQVAIMLIKERKQIVEKLLQQQYRNAQVEHWLQEEKSKVRNMSEGLAQENKKSIQMEAAVEKKLLELDMEREQARARLVREENKCHALEAEVAQLQQQLEVYQKQFGSDRREGPQSIEIRSSVAKPAGGKNERGGSPAQMTGRIPTPTKVFRNTPPNTPPEVRKIPIGTAQYESPERDATPMPVVSSDSTVRRTIMQLTNSTGKPERTVAEKPLPAEKPAELQTSRLNISAAGGATIFTAPSGGTTVFTTPSGTKISLNVGPPAPSNLPRKTSPIGRGTPPPVPPNKPVYIPQNTPRKDFVSKPGVGNRSDMVSPGPLELRSKPQPPTKFGITISKDKITISSPESPNENIKPIGGGPKPRTVISGSTASTELSPSVRKQSQSSVEQSGDVTDASPSTPNLDFFGPEMADLQQLLVSMVTGENSSSSIEGSTIATSHPDVHTSPLHKHAACGDLNELHKLVSDDAVDVNVPMKDGTTAVHCAAESGHQDCLKLLLDHGANVNASREDNFRPLHAAAGEGHSGCVKLLLSGGADIDHTDQSGWTALYWAASNGQTDCCTVLLDHGAKLDTFSTANWTPLHSAVHAGHAHCLKLLLTYTRPTDPIVLSPINNNHTSSNSDIVHKIVNMTDADGWTIVHLAAASENKDCLEVLARHCNLNLEQKDKRNRSVIDVASNSCKEYLQSLDGRHERTCIISIQLETAHRLAYLYHISTLKVDEQLTWQELEEQLSDVLLTHFHNVSVGLRTKRTSRHEHDSQDSFGVYSLGLSLDSVKCYSIGLQRWTPGAPLDNSSPFEILCNNDAKQIMIGLYGWEDGSVDGLAYETLISVTTLQNYLRLVEQYKNMIFYGPSGTGKTYLAAKIAHCVQMREQENGNQADIYSVTCTSSFNKTQLVDLLVEKGCLMIADTPPPKKQAPIIVFDDLGKISIASVFSELLLAMESRGPKYTFKINTDTEGREERYYLVDDCYIIGTMERSRFSSLDLSIQQHFRWVQLRTDMEPMRSLLQRHLYRQLVHNHSGRMPANDDPVYKAVSWSICVWQRLNDGLDKLGLSGLVFGPSHFLSCPIEANKSKAILRWLSLLWNHTIAPTVSEAVIKGLGTDTVTGGQEKVANTSLYVLMQKSIVSGCPLSGQEKERYLSSFHGSNELDIKMRSEKRDAHGYASPKLLSPSDDESTPENRLNKKLCPSPDRADLTYNMLSQQAAQTSIETNHSLSPWASPVPSPGGSTTDQHLMASRPMSPSRTLSPGGSRTNQPSGIPRTTQQRTLKTPRTFRANSPGVSRPMQLGSFVGNNTAGSVHASSPSRKSPSPRADTKTGTRAWMSGHDVSQGKVAPSSNPVSINPSGAPPNAMTSMTSSPYAQPNIQTSASQSAAVQARSPSPANQEISRLSPRLADQLRKEFFKELSATELVSPAMLRNMTKDPVPKI